MHDRTTHNIVNKGFSCMRWVVVRFNFTCNLTGDSPAISNFSYRERYAACKKTCRLS